MPSLHFINGTVQVAENSLLGRFCNRLDFCLADEGSETTSASAAATVQVMKSNDAGANKKLLSKQVSTGPTGRGFQWDANPGLHCACPGLLSTLPTGDGPCWVSFPVGRRSRWGAKAMPCYKAVQSNDLCIRIEFSAACVDELLLHATCGGADARYALAGVSSLC